MKILIADDEVVERIALEKILREYYKTEIASIKSVANGEQAVIVSRVFNPDIIFMDIKMPRMDGIVACGKIREFNKTAKIIIVTAFSDFEFAKQAITYNVSDYLVKPYSIKTLNNTVDKVVEELKTIRKDKTERLILQGSIATEFLTGIINNKKISPEEFEKYLISLNIKDNKYCFVIVNKNETIAHDGIGCFSFSFLSYSCYLLVGLNSSVLNDIISDTKILAKSEIESNSKKIDSVFISTLKKLSKESKYNSQKDLEKTLKNKIINCKYEEINKIGKDIVEEYFLKYGFGELFFDNLFRFVIREIQLLYKLNEEDAKLYAEKLAENKKELRQRSVEYCTEEFPKLLTLICDLYHENTKSNQEKLVENTINYLKDNYKNNIGMDNISEAMFVSKSYLSRVFSKQKKITVMDYLLTLRINEAKRMLIEGHSVSETSSEVGFSNPAYFSKSFKKETGISPSQFVENNRG